MTKAYTMIKAEMNRTATGIDGRKYYADSLKKDLLAFKEAHGYTFDDMAEIFGTTKTQLTMMANNYRQKQRQIENMKINATLKDKSLSQLEALLAKLKAQS